MRTGYKLVVKPYGIHTQLGKASIYFFELRNAFNGSLVMESRSYASAETCRKAANELFKVMSFTAYKESI